MGRLLTDSFGRTMTYLRVSVTDRCNFACVYCAPPEGIPVIDHEHLLDFDEIARVVRIFLEMGGRKVRLTGGEPLLRPQLEVLVARLSVFPGLEDMALTTNGFLLERCAASLKAAGLRRVNVSIDSLQRERFAALTRRDALEKVWGGIEAALDVGLKVKLNAVAVDGLSEEDMVGFGELARRRPIEVRFIEFMPLCGGGWDQTKMFPIPKLRATLLKHFDLVELPRGSNCAQSYRIAGGVGTIGIIASMTEPFCDSCTRLRLTADGKLRPCLFSNIEIDLRSLLRHDASDERIRDAIHQAVVEKPVGHGITLPLSDATNLPRIKSFGG